MSDEEGRHVRRKRYRGSHPRAFSEKYKERQPEKYPKDIERVLARGDTPAGSHRSIMVAQTIEALAPRPGETAIDATLGYGGHAAAILSAISPGGSLYGFDRDAEELSKTTRRLAAMGLGEARFVPVHANFARISEVLADADLEGVDLILADLGLSSMQIDDPERGFSFKRNGPLDMRMDSSMGESAKTYLRRVTEESLCAALRDNADEAQGGEIAHAICLRRGSIDTTRSLAEAVCSAFPGLGFKDPDMQRALRRSFQAIRIEVNGEFQSLEAMLASLPFCLKSGGRAAILSFHSGEDRRVDDAFSEGLRRGLYSAVATEAARPGREEQYANPRSSSAKLRWAVRA